MEHALTCPTEGVTIIWHEVCDLTANLLEQVHMP